MAGRWYEELSVGQAFEHEIRRTVTEADNMWFCGATCNPAAIHIDAEYCRETEFGRPLVTSADFSKTRPSNYTTSSRSRRGVSNGRNSWHHH